jgi:hypothetical protein
MDNIINITDENNPNVLLKVLVVFYILIGSSLIQPLLSKQWRNLVDNNRIVQHIIGITTLIALTTLLSNGMLDNVTIVIYSLVGYLWFIFSTKLDVHWNIIIMILLVMAYMHYNSLQQANNIVYSDKNLTPEEKNKITKQNSSNSLFIMLGILVVTIVGVTMYSNKKEVQYGGGYSIVNFLLY